MINIFAFRHAPTDWSAHQKLQGQTDIPLSQSGQSVAQGWSIPSTFTRATCLSSPLSRCMQTAKLMGLTPTPTPQLIEMDWGQWEGKTLAQLRQQTPTKMAKIEAKGLDMRPPDGQSPRDIQLRLTGWVNDNNFQSDMIWVTHKGVLRALYALASGWDMTDKPPQKLRDGCGHHFVLDADKITVKELNIPLE